MNLNTFLYKFSNLFSRCCSVENEGKCRRRTNRAGHSIVSKLNDSMRIYLMRFNQWRAGHINACEFI